MHGAWHDAWCWTLLRERLQASGHQTIAPDLPISDPAATFEDYADIALEAIDAATEPPAEVVVVGHSMGAVVASRVAGRRPVAQLVYLCAVLPRVAGTSRDGEPAQFLPGVFDGLVRGPHGTTSWRPEAARQAFYPDCPDDLAAAAVEHLRPQYDGIWRAEVPLERWPAVPTRTVVCTDDAVVSPAWSAWAAAHWLGVPVEPLRGGHSPMLACPDALADLLLTAGPG